MAISNGSPIGRGFFSVMQQGVCVVAAIAGAFLLMMFDTRPSFADGGLEYQSGGLFRRKGWVFPAIYARGKKSKVSLSPTVKTSSPSTTSKPRARRTRVASLGKQARLPVTTRKRSKIRTRKRKPPVRAKRDRTKSKKPVRIARVMLRPVPLPVAPQPSAIPLPVPNPSLSRLAGVDFGAPAVSAPPRRPSLTGGAARIVWQANRNCLPKRLKAALFHVALHFGRVRVTSTCRSRRHNRRVGGASRSYHLIGRAVDFRVFGNIRRAARYLRSVAGGYKYYGGGLFHIDTGPKRTW